MHTPFTLESYPCPLCGSTASRVVAKKAGIVVPLVFDIVACSSCDHVRVDPRVSDERLDELYDAAYYRGEGFDRTIDYGASTAAATVAANDAVLDTVAEAVGGSLAGVRWLDVGCGTGSLLVQARARGAEVAGSDASAFAVAASKEKGLTLVTDSELAARPGSFDVVSAIEVIEHVADPKGLLVFLRSCVREGGIVYVGTGNWNLVRRQPGTPYLMPEGHIQYFTPDRMRRLFAEVGLREADAVDRSWFVPRLLLRRARGLVPPQGLGLLARLARRVTPGLAPFPVGLR